MWIRYLDCGGWYGIVGLVLVCEAIGSGGF